MGPCELNDIANIKSRHVQSWAGQGVELGWYQSSPRPSGQVPALPGTILRRAAPAMPCNPSYAQLAQLQNFLLCKELQTSEE